MAKPSGFLFPEEQQLREKFKTLRKRRNEAALHTGLLAGTGTYAPHARQAGGMTVRPDTTIPKAEAQLEAARDRRLEYVMKLKTQKDNALVEAVKAIGHEADLMASMVSTYGTFQTAKQKQTYESMQEELGKLTSIEQALTGSDPSGEAAGATAAWNEWVRTAAGDWSSRAPRDPTELEPPYLLPENPDEVMKILGGAEGRAAKETMVRRLQHHNNLEAVLEILDTFPKSSEGKAARTAFIEGNPVVKEVLVLSQMTPRNYADTQSGTEDGEKLSLRAKAADALVQHETQMDTLRDAAETAGAQLELAIRENLQVQPLLSGNPDMSASLARYLDVMGGLSDWEAQLDNDPVYQQLDTDVEAAQDAVLEAIQMAPWATTREGQQAILNSSIFQDWQRRSGIVDPGQALKAFMGRRWGGKTERALKKEGRGKDVEGINARDYIGIGQEKPVDIEPTGDGATDAVGGEAEDTLALPNDGEDLPEAGEEKSASVFSSIGASLADKEPAPATSQPDSSAEMEEAQRQVEANEEMIASARDTQRSLAEERARLRREGALAQLQNMPA